MSACVRVAHVVGASVAGECPKGKAWFDLPTSDDVAHQLAECSNAGVCDRLKGDCICLSGFTGAACNRSTLTYEWWWVTWSCGTRLTGVYRQ